jgi:hypothetical protein
MDQEGRRHGASVQSDKLAGQSTRSGDTDLLSQYSARRNLEAITAAGSPQPRTLCHQWRKRGIERQMVVDGFDVRSKVEQSPHPRNDRRQYSDLRKANALTARALSLWQVSYFDTSHGPSTSTVRR